jgi:hypothetical protein
MLVGAAAEITRPPLLCGMVLIIAFFVIGMLFPELLPWLQR